MSQKKSLLTPEVVSEARTLDFCANLNLAQRRGLALCIDRKIVESGFADGLRAGNPNWEKARRQVVSDIIRRDDDLASLRDDIEAALGEARTSDDGATRNAAKAASNRVDGYEKFLREEGREHAGKSGYFEDDDAVTLEEQ